MSLPPAPSWSASGRRAPRLHPRGRLGLLLQAAAGRRAAGDRLPDPGRRHRPAQRPAAYLRPQLCGRHRRHRGRGVGGADHGGLRAGAPARHRLPVGRLARRGDGGRASGQHRPAQRPGPHRAFPGRARPAAAAGRAWAPRPASPARSTSTCWPTRSGSPPSTSTASCASCASASCSPFATARWCSTTCTGCASWPATTAAISTRTTA